MYVTQTYLGLTGTDAEFFVYYFYEDYNDTQKAFTEALQGELEKLGEIFEDKVTLMMPMPRSAAKIQAEIRKFEKLWYELKPSLPGLLLSPKPLRELSHYEEWCFFVPFSTTEPEAAIAAAKKIRELADEAITWNYKKNAEAPKRSFLSRLFGATEFKPGFGGFKIDLKKVF